MPTGAVSVLFLSDRNAASSILAEAILRVEGNGRFRPYSAGLQPAPTVDANIVHFLTARHLPVKGLRPKSVGELEAVQAPEFQFVITLSRAAGEAADRHPWRGDPVIAHWALGEEELDAGDESSPWAIRDAFWTLSRRIRIFASLPHRKATRHSLENRLHALQAV
jgi:arsenate reductase